MKLSTQMFRERTAARTHGTTTFNASGSYPTPYGKTAFTVGGKGSNGTAAHGGNVSGDNSTYSPGNPTTPSYVPASPTTPTYVAASPTTPTYVAGTATPPSFSYLDVESYSDYNGVYEIWSSTYCPSPNNAPTQRYSYICTAQYTANPPNADYYTANPPNADYYTANPPNVAYYTANPPNAETYYAGNPNYNPYVNATNGSPASILGQIFPGGTGGPATAINAVVMAIPFSSTATPVTVPSGGYVTIQNT